MKSPLWMVAVLAGSAIAAPGTAVAAESCGVPASILDLENWKETLPTGSAGHPDEIKQPKLANYAKAPWFTANPGCDGVRFRAAVNGVTTGGSGNPRSELREMDGSDGASWSTTSGTHTMVIDEAITHLPNGKPHVVAGQIHDDEDDVTVFRLEGTQLYVTKGDDTHYQLVTGSYRLGTKFQAKFVAGDGKIKAYYNGELKATVDAESSGDYFKAGAYTQANCEKSSPCEDSNYGEVVVYGLKVTHS
ncbi:polysaccharide lyase family 7 protein [Amycolatopsis minnesotensis]|uniref:Polysaccharide lyase family 7 protein n=1 Tax=Amycolatopsis minnesotensis TaxID=337894 RepID=A0ABN2SK14_9PSEU